MASGKWVSGTSHPVDLGCSGYATAPADGVRSVNTWPPSPTADQSRSSCLLLTCRAPRARCGLAAIVLPQLEQALPAGHDVVLLGATGPPVQPTRRRYRGIPAQTRAGGWWESWAALARRWPRAGAPLESPRTVRSLREPVGRLGDHHARRAAGLPRGDSAYGPCFAEIGSRYAGIEAALVPVGVYAPRWFMQNMHADPEEAVQAVHDLGARVGGGADAAAERERGPVGLRDRGEPSIHARSCHRFSPGCYSSHPPSHVTS